MKALKKTGAASDIWLLSLTIALLLVGWFVLYSASAIVADAQYGDQYYFLKRQILWSLIGVAAMLVAHRIDLKFLQKMTRPFYLVMVVSLVLVLVAGHEVGGSKRWLRLGGFNVQPSEFAKLAIVLVIADYLDRKRSRLTDFWTGFAPLFALVGFMLCLILLEKDLGTPVLLLTVTLVMMYLGGARYKHVLGVLAAGLPFIGYLILFVPYRRARLFSFLDPWNDAQGTGYQLVQSFLALGSGGFWGKGSGQSMMKMHYLPESETDFVFSIFGEEMGFIGAAVLLCLFFALTYRAYRVAMKSGQWYSTLLAAGISLLLGIQVLINLGVVTGLLPTKGIPLPFVSSGGSSLIVTLSAIGLVLNISRDSGPAAALPSRRSR